MKVGIRVMLVVIAIFVALFGLQMAASESGEVVVVTTTDPATHQPKETRLWVVDHDHHAWIRAGSPASGWYKRLSATPTINVKRSNVAETYTAVPLVAMRDTINALYATKYGWADKLVGAMMNRSASVPIRLDLALDPAAKIPVDHSPAAPPAL